MSAPNPAEGAEPYIQAHLLIQKAGQTGKLAKLQTATKRVRFCPFASFNSGIDAEFCVESHGRLQNARKANLSSFFAEKQESTVQVPASQLASQPASQPASQRAGQAASQLNLRTGGLGPGPN